MEFKLSAATAIEAAPGDVFGAITDVEHLPDWNLEIPRVIDVPPMLTPGAEWLVEIHAMKSHWNSRSRVVEFDPQRGVFAYRSQSDDGNPSYANWRWEVAGEGAVTTVRVSVEAYPRTFLRKRFISRIRRRGLERAMHQSLASLREQLVVHQQLKETT